MTIDLDDVGLDLANELRPGLPCACVVDGDEDSAFAYSRESASQIISGGVVMLGQFDDRDAIEAGQAVERALHLIGLQTVRREVHRQQTVPGWKMVECELDC